MQPRKKNAKDLTVSLSNVESIDDLMNRDDKTVLSYTSPTLGKDIDLTVFKFKGDDILNKTSVHSKNKRKQMYLTPLSLAPLINSLITHNQVSPALGRLEDDGSITIFYGSQRRMASYYAETEYVVLASKDLTDDVAEGISDAENVSDHISLIDRGHLWLAISDSEGLSSRAISEQIEQSKVSHTIIAAGIAGAKLPPNIIKLYPTTNMIGRKKISKLSAACQLKSCEEILAFVEQERSEVTTNLWDAYREENWNVAEELATKLTNDISLFCTPAPAPKSPKSPNTNKVLAKGINAKVSKSGDIEYITFDSKLSNEKTDKIVEFLKHL